MYVTLTAEYVVFTPCPPGPENIQIKNYVMNVFKPS